MRFIELKLRCPHNVNGISADPQPDWSFDSLVSELDAIEKKLNATSDISGHFTKDQPTKLRAAKKKSLSKRGFVMRVSESDLEIEDSDSNNEDDEKDSSVFPGRRFVIDESYMSDDSDHDIALQDKSYLVEKVALVEAEAHELTRELQLSVSKDVRTRLSALETDLFNENEKFVSSITKVEKQRKTQQEMERKIDLQYQRTTAEALDNHLTTVQRDHEHISNLEERRIRDDAAREDAKRKEKALMEEKIRQEKIKAEETRVQAERAEIDRAAAEAEKIAAEEAASKRADESLREAVKKELEESTKKSLVKASENALELERRRSKIYEELSAKNEALMPSSSQAYRKHGLNINRVIKNISASIENVRTKARDLVNLMNSPEYPQSISIMAFAEKVVSNCENSQKSTNSFIFACSRVIVLVTSKIPLAMDILIAELNRACIYTVPKYIEYSQSAFGSKEAYFKSLGYKENDGKTESIDSYVERLGLYMKLYGALVQTEVGGFKNPHGLEEGWAWIARFLNSLPANLYTAVALKIFLEMCGFVMYRKFRNQFEKLLRMISREFVNALKEGSSNSYNAKLEIVKTSILNYIESNQYKKEPEGSQLIGHLNSNHIS